MRDEDGRLLDEWFEIRQGDTVKAKCRTEEEARRLGPEFVTVVENVMIVYVRGIAYLQQVREHKIFEWKDLPP